VAIETHIGRAQDRVEAEQAHVTDEQRAYDQFRTEVESLSVGPAGREPSSPATAAGAVSMSAPRQRGQTATEQVREAFDRTVRPHSVEDVDREESLVETLRDVFGDSIALVLSPETPHRLTPQVKAGILSQVAERQREIQLMTDGLGREADSLQSARRDVDGVIDWLVDANETPLSQLGFAALQRRHERLAAHRATCETLLRDRQKRLQSADGPGLDHRVLVNYLYQDFPVSYPVLSTVVRLADLLADCQRVVRNHLVRRV
jgi:hypothetical protein